jgi:ribosome-associated heat shock protein Hsp15
MSAAHQPDIARAGHDEACRLDVWLWRARFFKTRALAARFLEEGRVRVGRHGSDPVRVDKASRTVRCGDALVFAVGGRLIAVQVAALGDRRGPASEAQALYRHTPPTHS